jgi:hypothetical protein
MSALFGHNDKPYISWKGKTFSQVTSTLKRNAVYNPKTNIRQKATFFLPNPVRLYRKEIATTFDMSSCKYRVSIDELNQPGGSVINSALPATKINGLVNTIDNNLPKNTCEYPGTAACSVFLSPAQNAKRRVRSSGTYKKSFNDLRNNDTYYTSTNQYLVSRNKTFTQNQYNYIRQGNATAKPGTAEAANNVYAAGGIPHCEKYFISNATNFQYKWVNGTTYTVTVPIGYYTTDDLNTLLFKTMASNYHYFITASPFNSNQNIVYNNNYLSGQVIVFVLKFGYNFATSQVVLITSPVSTTFFPSSTFSVPSSGTWTNPTTAYVPGFIIADSTFQAAVGFGAGSYPSTTTYSAGMTLMFYSAFKPGIINFVGVTYKPNNSQFAQQGAVSSSSLIQRVKYDTITNAAATCTPIYGTAVANALAYGVSENAYTLKDKIGYPNKKTPIVTKDGKVTCAPSDCKVDHL